MEHVVLAIYGAAGIVLVAALAYLVIVLRKVRDLLEHVDGKIDPLVDAAQDSIREVQPLLENAGSLTKKLDETVEGVNAGVPHIVSTLEGTNRIVATAASTVELAKQKLTRKKAGGFFPSLW